jgi:hypothetical protein
MKTSTLLKCWCGVSALVTLWWAISGFATGEWCYVPGAVAGLVNTVLLLVSALIVEVKE